MTKNDKRLEEVRDMLRKLTWNASRRTGVAYEELISEAHWAFMKATEKFDRNKGAKFSSWCYRKVYFHLIHHLRARLQDRHIFYEEIRDEMLEPAPVLISFQDRLKDLSPEARNLVERLLARSEEPGRVKLGQVCSDLSYELGLDPMETEHVIQEVREMLV